MRLVVLGFVFSGVLLLGAGCNPPREQLAVFNQSFESGDLLRAEEYADKRLKKRDNPGGADLLWALQAATVARMQKAYGRSTEYFDRCEEMLQHYDNQFRGVDVVGTTAVNENVLPYRGQAYDGIMVNTYKALNFMAIGDMELARVEFNRALDRQRRAKEKFNEEIRKVEAELAEQERKKSQYDVRATVDDPNTMATIEEQYPMLSNFEPYPDFVNPFTTYMAGLFFALEGERERAVFLFKESYGMVGENAYLGQDLLTLDQAVDVAGAGVADTVWVIFENGLGPVKEEFRIDLPIILSPQGVFYTGIALPQLRFRQQAYPYLNVEADGQSYQTQVVADMDRVVQTEFKKDFRGILIRSIVSATAKAVVQAAVDKNSSNDLAGLLIAAYTAATTTADVRIWTSLPKNFQVARLPRPEGGFVRVWGPGGAPFDVDVGGCRNAIVYVRIVAADSPPIYEVMKY
jgi:hypothetical protein